MGGGRNKERCAALSAADFETHLPNSILNQQKISLSHLFECKPLAHVTISYNEVDCMARAKPHQSLEDELEILSRIYLTSLKRIVPSRCFEKFLKSLLLPVERFTK